jgi:CRISPR-associated protein Csm5
MNNIIDNTALGCKIPLQILTLSPLHIGGTDVLSPLADYWMDNNKNICLVNNEALAELVSSSGQVNRYVRAVENIAIERKGNFLQSLVKDDLKGELADILTGEKIPSFGIQNPTEIDTCIKTDGLPYIPGSSLKGAIRSAILQDWLTSGTPESENALTEFLNALMFFVNKNDLSDGKKIDEIEKKFRETMEEKLFGKLKDNNRLAASCLRVTDSNTGTFEDLAMFQLKRFNLFGKGKKNDTIPIIKECINTGSKFSARINIDYLSCPRKNFHPLFKDINNRTQLFELLNRITLKLLDYEINVLETEGIEKRKLEDYSNFMLDMKDRIESNGNNKAIIRLGFGKMQFYQTIALGIFKKQGSKESDGRWYKYLCFCEKFKDVPDVYPITRVITNVGQRQLGWVELF